MARNQVVVCFEARERLGQRPLLGRGQRHRRQQQGRQLVFRSTL